MLTNIKYISWRIYQGLYERAENDVRHIIKSESGDFNSRQLSLCTHEFTTLCGIHRESKEFSDVWTESEVYPDTNYCKKCVAINNKRGAK